MNRIVVRIGLLALLCCARVPGQNANPDCRTTEPQTIARAELDVWLESLDRGPCAGPPKVAGSGLVSFRSLAHTPLPKARQEFNRGVEARRKGRASDAAEHFATAVRLDPDFVDANAFAGLVFVEVRQPSRALPYYQQALRLEPENGSLLSNLASVLIALDRPAEAEPHARRAVLLAPGSVEAHYMLGFALFAQARATQETVTHLTIAAEKYLPAREMLARIQLKIASPRLPC